MPKGGKIITSPRGMILTTLNSGISPRVSEFLLPLSLYIAIECIPTQEQKFFSSNGGKACIFTSQKKYPSTYAIVKRHKPRSVLTKLVNYGAHLVNLAIPPNHKLRQPPGSLSTLHQFYLKITNNSTICIVRNGKPL